MENKVEGRCAPSVVAAHTHPLPCAVSSGKLWMNSKWLWEQRKGVLLKEEAYSLVRIHTLRKVLFPFGGVCVWGSYLCSRSTAGGPTAYNHCLFHCSYNMLVDLRGESFLFSLLSSPPTPHAPPVLNSTVWWSLWLEPFLTYPPKRHREIPSGMAHMKCDFHLISREGCKTLNMGNNNHVDDNGDNST